MFLWPASWVNISHAGGRCSRSISVPTSGNTFLSPQHLESEKCKRNLESTNLRWRKFPKRFLYLGHSLDSSTRMGCSKMVIPSYPSALWWCPVASSNSSNSKLWHGEQGDLEAMGLAVFPSRPYRPDLGSTSLGNNLLQMHWLQQEYPVSTMPISSTQLWSSTWESNCGSYFHSLFLRLLLFPCWAWHNASGSEHVSALASLCFCDRPAESIFRMQVGGLPDQFQCPHLETPFCHLNILKVRNAREIWRARTCDEENFRNVSSILDTVWIHRRGWDAAKWWSLHIPLHSDGAQLPQAIPQTASSGMASRVIWKRWVWLSFPSRTWAAHHLETTCFRCTDFSKNTQYPQCQYLLPTCGAQPEKANVAHTFIPYFLATLALWRFHKMECSHLWHQPRQGHWYCFFRSRWEQLTRETTSWAEFLNIRLQQGEIPAEYKETNCFVSSSENSNFPHGELSYLESLPADLGSTSLGNNLLQMHWLQQEYPVSTMPISSTQLWSSTWESKCSSYFHSLFFSDTGAMALWQDGMQSLVTSAKTGALILLLSQQMGTTDSRNHQLGWISEHKTSAGGNPRRVQGNKLLCQQFWKQQLPAWRAELFGIFACRLGKHITWKQPASDALTSARIPSIHNANIFYPLVELNQRKQLWLILSFFIF